MNNINLRKDPLTGQEFTPLRINQKFATRKNRIKFNNDKSNRTRHSLSYINDLLRTNYRILSELMQKEKTKNFDNQYLIGKGFSFAVITHIQKHGEQNEKALYNFLIVPKNQSSTQIIKYKEL